LKASVDDIEVWLVESVQWTEALLGSFAKRSTIGPDEISEAVGYALLGGGKRIRPAVVKLVAEATRAAEDDVITRSTEAAAIAIECVHTYSLVHDDLPCMDDDDLRRGRPTTHKVYGEATAVLVGDALLTVAFETLAEGLPQGLVADGVLTLARAAGPAGMVGGQALDLAGEGQDLAADAIRGIHGLKTAELLAAAAELGAIAGGGSKDQRSVCRQFGRSLGLAFQAVDDVLDVTGDAATLGKTPGKDAEAQKGTLVAVLGLDGARAEAEKHAGEARRLSELAGLGALGLGLVDRLAQRLN
jgi:geranylgeranyl pyrophosphate synthase